MKKVLIITYYWPPSGGAGVQRWLKFAKYLPEYGWEPIIYTPENGEFPVLDLSLEKDIPKEITVIKTPIWEPYTFYKRFIGQKKTAKINHGFLSENKKPKLTENISVWLRGNFFIPDARVFWIKPSIKFLSKYLETNPVDAIVSTGPPHSMHMIAMGLQEKFNIKWIADFRDPWTNIDFYKDLMLTSMADKKHHLLEKRVLQKANEIVVVGNTMAVEFNAIVPRTYRVITNGYDEADLIKTSEVTLDEKFSIAHIGTLNKDRNPESLWKVLAELIKDPDFEAKLEIKLIGKVDYLIFEKLKYYNLEKYLNRIDYIPHNEVVKHQSSSQILLLCLNNTPNAKGVLTGKFFEYLASGRPILAIGPKDGDVAKILNDTKSGYTSDFHEIEGLKSNIEKWFELFKSNSLNSISDNHEQYSRKQLTSELIKLL